MRKFSLSDVVSAKNPAELAEKISEEIKELGAQVGGVLNKPLLEVPYRELIAATSHAATHLPGSIRKNQLKNVLVHILDKGKLNLKP